MRSGASRAQCGRDMRVAVNRARQRCSRGVVGEQPVGDGGDGVGGRRLGSAHHRRSCRTTLQPDAHFGRILAAYGGVFVAGSLAWGMVVDGFRPDRFDYLGAAVCLAGVGLIMYGPR